MLNLCQECSSSRSQTLCTNRNHVTLIHRMVTNLWLMTLSH
jgi:hypothetical protein